jgi:hypothetical protein
MAIFYTETGSIANLQTSGSVQITGSLFLNGTSIYGITSSLFTSASISGSNTIIFTKGDNTSISTSISPTLQQVVNSGNTITSSIVVGSLNIPLSSTTASLRSTGSNSVELSGSGGGPTLYVGQLYSRTSSIATSFIINNNSNSFSSSIQGTVTGNRTLTIPDATGNIPININGFTANSFGVVTLPLSTYATTGSNSFTGSQYFSNLDFSSTNSGFLLTYNTSNGLMTYISSSILSVGAGAGGSDTQIQFNSGSQLSGNSAFRFIYTSQSLQQGIGVIASGIYSHAQGSGSVASGQYSHAEGRLTSASGDWSHAEGLGTIAAGPYQHVQGEYNISDTAQSAFIIGNGTSNLNRSNLVYASGSIFQITGSFITSGSGTFTNGLVVTGSLTLSSGSTEFQVLNTGVKLGNSGSDVHTVTGSLNITGSINSTGSISTQGNLSLYDNILLNYKTVSISNALFNFDAGQIISGALYVSGATQSGGSGHVLTYNTSSGQVTYIAISNPGGFATTGSNIFTGHQTINGNVTINGTASVYSLNTVYVTSSIIYSSGSNQFGDDSNDTQTLYGNVVVPTGSLTLTGSLNITGSLNFFSGSEQPVQIQNGVLILSQVSASLNFANDAAAAAGGVPLGGLYRNGNAISIRIV